MNAGSASRLRSPDEVMRLKRLGASFPTRLSFTRSLLRRLAAEKAKVSRPLWDIDGDGYGRAVYSVVLAGNTYSLVAFSTQLADEDRTDRVIAEAWDTSFVLYDGTPDAPELDRLSRNAPLQEAGRFRESDLVLSRANKSVRFFEHVVARLASGRQPDRDLVLDVGYLMRTTAVYGNGKFGIADRFVISHRPEMAGPFQAEMLAVWLIRGFSHDLVEHMARCRSPETFVSLQRSLKQHLGMGNSTGLGMAPFLVHHPALLNAWITAREKALAMVLGGEALVKPERILDLWRNTVEHLRQWNVDDAGLSERIAILRKEWADELVELEHAPSSAADIAARSRLRSVDFQELAAALLIEAAGPVVDAFCDGMAVASEGHLMPAMPLSALRALLDRHFGWASGIDFREKSETSQFWYVSEEKLEPRLGQRYEEPGADRELPLDIARQIGALREDLSAESGLLDVASFVARYPQHRHVVRRVQMADAAPYSEIRDNLIAGTCLPIDMLRCKLSFFGAAKFDPRSDRWTRITLFQGAPDFDDIGAGETDNCWLPVLT
ncbi:hypothetical protein [Rhizobium sp. Root483D2]|uniref:hypothetical protein n=1 Tax=Rhizobium sp. Root483D2 TaxID=1736545 RepID=UPI000715C9A0|nr:hypothetical protein [Rhizobium sp. Root483D2]KQY33810.1 hypothetical protein ASD32_21230 [Rhizobium sp. Root483D2]